MTGPGDAAASALGRLADALLPGDERWPAAGCLGLGPLILDLAGRHGGHLERLRRLLASPPAGLLSPDRAGVTAALRQLEAADPDLFGVLRALAYEAYYSHPRVQEVLAARTRWRPGPAQPLGYPRPAAPEPDPSAVLARGVAWRPDGTQTGARVRREQERDLTRDWTEEEIRAWRQ